MIISEFIEVKWNAKNVKMYTGKGYIFSKVGDILKVKIEDLALNSFALVNFQCDYCNNLYSQKWVYYNRNKKRSNIINKDCCENCINEKIKESNIIVYGVEWSQQTKEIQDKIKATNFNKYGSECYFSSQNFKDEYKEIMLDKYGVLNSFQSEEVKNKIKQFYLNNYNVEHYSQTNEFKEKYKNTCLEKYGVEHIMQVEEFKNKSKETLFNNYGVEHALENKDILDDMKNNIILKYGVENISQLQEVKNKKSKTFYDNQTVATSRQQRYLHKLLGGELNYSNNTPSLDIAFPDKKIYLEYNGSGHMLSVKCKKFTLEEFNKNEIKRYYALKRLGWKCIKINSFRDYLPSDKIIYEEINKAFEWFKSNKPGHFHYNIEIGNKINDINYGKLRKITEKDLMN